MDSSTGGRAVPRAIDRRAVVLAAIVWSVGCGRFDYAPPEPESATLTALDATTVTQGRNARLALDVQPAVARRPGASFRLAVPHARLATPSTYGREIEVVAGADGAFPEVTLIVPFDVREGTVLRLEASIPISGALEFVVQPAGAHDELLDGATYRIADGLAADAPLTVPPDVSTALRGGSAAMLFAPEDSAFPEGAYVVADGPLRVFRGSLDAPLASVGALPDLPPGVRIVQTAFTAPGSPYGDLLLVCARGAGGGVFAVHPDGTLTAWRTSESCHGLLVDEPLSVHDWGVRGPVYVHGESGALVHVAPDMTEQVVAIEGMPSAAEGLQLYVCPGGLLPAKLVLLSSGGAGVGADGFARAVEPWVLVDRETPWATDLAEPLGATFTGKEPIGAALVVALAGTGEVVALRDDGSRMTLASGLSEPVGVVRDPEVPAAFWVLERGRGSAVRIGPPTPPGS